MRFLAALAVVPLLLAGCSGGGGGAAAEPTLSPAPTSTAPLPPPVPTTDTLHLLDAPHMTPVAPTGSDARTPVSVAGSGGPGGGPQNQPTAVWRYQVTKPTNVTAGEVHVWVDIKEQMVDVPGTPLRPACSWRLTANLGGDTEPIVGCVNEATGTVSPGMKELTYTLVLTSPIELEANETITLTLQRTPFSLSPNNAVDALSGSPDHDSRITLKGLLEPVQEPKA